MQEFDVDVEIPKTKVSSNFYSMIVVQLNREYLIFFRKVIFNYLIVIDLHFNLQYNLDAIHLPEFFFETEHTHHQYRHPHRHLIMKILQSLYLFSDILSSLTFTNPIGRK